MTPHPTPDRYTCGFCGDVFDRPVDYRCPSCRSAAAVSMCQDDPHPQTIALIALIAVFAALVAAMLLT